MSARWSLAMLSLSMGACFSLGPVCTFREPQPCDGAVACLASEVLVAQEESFDFESPCTVSTCGTHVRAGAATLVPSIHPSLTALSLGPGAVVELEATVASQPDGAEVSAVVRCDPGGALFCEGDSRSRLDAPANAEPGWSARAWRLRTPSRLFDALSDAQSARAPSVLRFVNRGTGACAIDAVRWRISALVCVAFCSIEPSPPRPRDSGVRAMDAAALDARTDADADGDARAADGAAQDRDDGEAGSVSETDADAADAAADQDADAS